MIGGLRARLSKGEPVLVDGAEAAVAGRRAAPASRRARLRPRKRWIVWALLAAGALAGSWGWLRDSSLVAVERVSIDGLPAEGSGAVRSALRAAAMDMTTLHVREDALRTAVAPFTIVREVRAVPDFPNGLKIEVLTHTPVAVVSAEGRQVPIAPDGTILRGAVAPRGLPVIPAELPPTGARLTDRSSLRAVALLAAAPPALRARVRRVSPAAHRMTVALADGPELRFGGEERLAAKWAAAARVIADPAAAGAAYIDLRVPERPAAGGLPAERSSTGPEPAGPDAGEGTVPEPGGIAPQAGTGTQAPPVENLPAG